MFIDFILSEIGIDFTEFLMIVKEITMDTSQSIIISDGYTFLLYNVDVTGTMWYSHFVWFWSKRLTPLTLELQSRYVGMHRFTSRFAWNGTRAKVIRNLFSIANIIIWLSLT